MDLVLMREFRGLGWGQVLKGTHEALQGRALVLISQVVKHAELKPPILFLL